MEKTDQREEFTISFVQANLFSFFVIPPVLILFGIPYYLIWGFNEIFESFSKIADASLIILFILLLGGIVLHELIHGLFWAIKTKNGWQSIEFGVNWKVLSPYAHCKEPLKVKDYYSGVVMPGLLLGILPLLISLFYGNVLIWLYGFFFTIAAGGDLIYFILLTKLENNIMDQDHPEKVGFILYQDNQNKAKIGE